MREQPLVHDSLRMDDTTAPVLKEPGRSASSSFLILIFKVIDVRCGLMQGSD